MSLTYKPETKAAMLAAIGDTGQGVPFDGLGLSIENGVAVLRFYRGGEWIVREVALDSTEVRLDVYGHMRIRLV